jgi:predicted aldo/keto reductase-like oxidoreductase
MYCRTAAGNIDIPLCVFFLHDCTEYTYNYNNYEMMKYHEVVNNLVTFTFLNFTKLTLFGSQCCLTT